MAATASTMVPLGTQAPDFTLPNPQTGKTVTLSTLPPSKATVIFFLCNHCPFVQHIFGCLLEVINEYQAKGVQFIGINANDAIAYPQDGPSAMKALANEYKLTFLYLFDETQNVAKAYQAACTPDFFVFDAILSLVYRGQFDDSRPGNALPVDGHSLRAALEALLKDQPPLSEQKPSVGCNIKWKKL